MSDLAAQNCEPGNSDTPTLDARAAADLLGRLDSAWQLSGSVLEREFNLDNFRDAFGLATRMALLAEEQGHHPDLEIGWGRVKVSLTSHSAGGLTSNDFVMAAKIDRLA